MFVVYLFSFKIRTLPISVTGVEVIFILAYTNTTTAVSSESFKEHIKKKINMSYRIKYTFIFYNKELIIVIEIHVLK